MKPSELIHSLDTEMARNNLSYDTRKAYRGWVERYINFIKGNGSTHAERLSSFRDSLSNLSITTQRQAFFSVRYMYKAIGQEAEIKDVKPPTGKRNQKIFNVLTPAQVEALINALPQEYKLIAQLMYGTGMRIEETLRLRIKDVDFDQSLIYVQEGKGDKARVLSMPEQIAKSLRQQVKDASALWTYDSGERPGVSMPHGMDKKNKSLSKSLEWYWVFPNERYGKDPDGGEKKRHHVYDFQVQDAFRTARKKAKLPAYTTPHILRHTYATHYLKEILAQLPAGIPNVDKFARDILREKMGHVSTETTEIYIHLATPKNPITDYSPLSAIKNKT